MKPRYLFQTLLVTAMGLQLACTQNIHLVKARDGEFPGYSYDVVAIDKNAGEEAGMGKDTPLIIDPETTDIRLNLIGLGDPMALSHVDTAGKEAYIRSVTETVRSFAQVAEAAYGSGDGSGRERFRTETNVYLGLYVDSLLKDLKGDLSPEADTEAARLYLESVRLCRNIGNTGKAVTYLNLFEKRYGGTPEAVARSIGALNPSSTDIVDSYRLLKGNLGGSTE